MFRINIVRYTGSCLTRVFKRSVTATGRKYNSSSLTSCAELNDGLQKPDWKTKLRVIDARFNLDGRDYFALHQKNRISGSKFFSFDDCRDVESPYMTMLPSAEQFSNYVTGLGISNEHHVVVYDHDEMLNLGAFFSPRVWWMFRAFGHNKVSVLDGGFGKWLSDGYPTVTGPYNDDEQLPRPDGFRASSQLNFFVNFESMKKNIESKESVQVIDTRLHDDYVKGHIPKSLLTPFTDFFKEDRTMKSVEELKSFFKDQQVDVDSDAFVTCEIGVSAAIAAHALLQCSGREVFLYDGSFNEWKDRAPDLVSFDGEGIEKN